MLLTISTTREQATDLGFLLHKHPEKFQTSDFSFGKVRLFYPERDPNKTTFCLMLEIDPIALVRGRRKNGESQFALEQYVNDRPYVVSSFLSVAIAQTLSSALNGTCKTRPELVQEKFPLEIHIPVLPAPKGGEPLIRSFFEPLGYECEIKRIPLDPKFPDWGESRYYSLALTNNITIKELLSHLYVLIPALDLDKHYFIDKGEIDKLVKKGEGWLTSHPQKQVIVGRYLLNIKHFARSALQKLNDEEHIEEKNETQEPEDKVKKESLNKIRLKEVVKKISESGAEKVLDLGCGEGKLTKILLQNKQFSEILAMDVSYSELLVAKERLNYEQLPERQKERLKFIQGSLIYKDPRLQGFDAAAVVEVIEHMDLNRLRSFERVLFEFSRPKTVVLTTPNREYNVLYDKLKNFRHHDHRFEWTRSEFQDWSGKVCDKFGYSVEFFPVGEVAENIGASTQMAVFTLGD
ncbi:3' terminal RNA ribose 2'-O-methyltransferase Hen1 [Leptospira koniambonensis]|uniref:Small RNA 2'-O-methyltransferase n=1 Tax=Leptospira koniambonensis TaxID=2484950 RepID=A0A4R9J985_9LEPT|nr:3' terminal RNA ribose 2'-O-methyltransferase Hen1 [Leptospira koniambonensis]TGL35356.1 3' terminal RNA ribose 2'-O-methyltransferase Hen1 [Leptospira koniambonensis]